MCTYTAWYTKQTSSEVTTTIIMTKTKGTQVIMSGVLLYLEVGFKAQIATRFIHLCTHIRTQKRSVKKVFIARKISMYYENIHALMTITVTNSP
jgi:hypothetical protein